MPNFFVRFCIRIIGATCYTRSEKNTMTHHLDKTSDSQSKEKKTVSDEWAEVTCIAFIRLATFYLTFQGGFMGSRKNWERFPGARKRIRKLVKQVSMDFREAARAGKEDPEICG